MKQFKKWMFAAIILCGTATMLTSCLFEDNPSTPSRPIPEGADSKDYQPSDVSVALLGSLSSYADEEVINYWFTNVEHHVTYKTMVVITNEINETNKANMFVTVWLGILEISTGKLTTANAGHEFPIINVNGKYELLKDKHGIAIGALPKAKYKDHELMLKKGDSVFVYTDGVAEATDSKNELFGTERTIEALNALPPGISQKEVLEGVRAAVDAFVKEAPQFDDLTMLGFKYYGPGGKDE
jgi:hypothetical protein